MLRQLRLGDGTFVLDLPADWQVEWQQPFKGRIRTTIPEAPVLVAADCFHDPEGLAENRVAQWLTPYDDSLPKVPANKGLSYMLGFAPSLRGAGPHIVVADIHAFRPNKVRRIEFALPLGEIAPQGRDPRENTAFLAWATKYEPLSTLLSLLPKVRLAKQETALDRIAAGPGEARASLARAFHFLLPSGWTVESAEGDGFRFALRDPEDRAETCLWIEIKGLRLPAPAVQTPNLLERVVDRLAEESADDGYATTRYAVSYPRPGEALLQRYQPYGDESGIAKENRRAIRLALVEDWQFLVFHDFAYPVARLQESGFPALRDDLWQRFLDGWIAPEL